MTSRKQLGHTELRLEQGDLTLNACQAIVNAANECLAGGGGVDGAIHLAGGPEIMAECRKIGGCPTGQAVITTAGRLRAEKVIHTVGPIYSGSPQDPQLLASCYRESLRLARKYGLRSVAFASISTGIYGYPLELAAPVALQTIKEQVEENYGAFDLICMVLFNAKTLAAYEKALAQLIRP